MLEAAVVRRVLDDPILDVVDWMTGVAQRTLLAANDSEPLVMICRPAGRPAAGPGLSLR